MLRHVLAVIVRGSDGVLIRATVHTNYINHYTAYFYARCRTHHRPMGGWQCKMEAAKAMERLSRGLKELMHLFPGDDRRNRAVPALDI